MITELSSLQESKLIEKNVFLEARKRNGIVEMESVELPKWVNIDKIKNGQDFVRNNFFSVFFAHLISLIFLLAYTPVRLVLIRTGKSESRLKSLKRYLSTLLHIKQWYEQDIIKTHGEAVKDIRKIRKIHSQVAKNIEKCRRHENDKNEEEPIDVTPMKMKVKNEYFVKMNQISIPDANLIHALQQDFRQRPLSHSTDNNNNNCEKCPLNTMRVVQNTAELADDTESHIISQLDMAVTQFCFMGFITLYPKHFGIDRHDDENVKGLEGFIHLWALIGHLLGIEDEFNLCLKGNYRQIQGLLNQILIPELQNCHPTTVNLWTSLTTGISSFIPFISLRALLVFIKRILETPILPGDSVIEHSYQKSFISSSTSLIYLLSPYDILCYQLMISCFSSWLQYKSLRLILNSLLRLAVYLSSMRFIPVKNQSHFSEKHFSTLPCVPISEETMSV